MNIIFWGNGQRGLSCLKALIRHGYNIKTVIAHPNGTLVEAFSREKGLEVVCPENPNDKSFQKFLEEKRADIFTLAAYGKILKRSTIDLAKIICINLHGGKLPQYRGSSPMNWSLINGEKQFGLSAIRVDSGVDTGDIIAERVFEINKNDTIVDLHKTANQYFPELLIEAIKRVEKGNFDFRIQDDRQACYYPLRNSDDGFVLWDLLTARQVYDMVRALTEPYPCALSIYNGREIKLVEAEMYEKNFYGVPGKIYITLKNKFLICAKDKCLWITKAVYKNNDKSIMSDIERYSSLATVSNHILKSLRGK